jgi:2-methylisocitrate lyase-like PEP mutase family enzyme
MLQSLGYPAVATASASIAFSLGYDDGQKLTFAAMTEAIRRIATSVSVPVTADIEAGYAEGPEDVAKNMREIMEAGAVGINLEDNPKEGGYLYDTDFQCARIRAVREMASREGIPLVINARTDVYITDKIASEQKYAETVARARAYLNAGGDCIYPIGLGHLQTLKKLKAETNAPINVYAPMCRASLRELEDAGIMRVSLGPAMIKASLTVMRKIARGLQQYGSFDPFTKGIMSSDEIRQYVRKEPM